jgi:hypothetical protein
MRVRTPSPPDWPCAASVADPHRGDGAAHARVLPADVRAVQGRRRTGAGGPGHRSTCAAPVPGRSRTDAFVGVPLAMAARALLGWARSARCASPPARAPGLADATLAEVERDGQGRGPQLADTDGDETAAILFTVRLDRRAQGRGLPPPPLRRAGRDAADRVRDRARRRRPADLPAVRAVRSRAGADLGDPGHGSHASGARRSTQAGRGDRTLRRQPPVRLAGVDAGAGRARRAAADRAAG